ncbi:MAG: neutral zinc metallopeptidase [Blastocatellia bacterium]
MLWRNRRQSENVEDRRGISRGGLAVGGGLGTIVIVLIAVLLGADPGEMLQQMPSNSSAPGSETARPSSAEEEELKQFVSVALAETEDVWTEVFRQSGRQYRKPTLVLFTDQVSSACGIAGSAVGPFYCPTDQKLYIDLSFYRELKTRFRAPGDFAQAYVLAHEVGHHVQNLLGSMDRMHAAQGRVGKAEANQLSVRLELQADFLAGVWAHHAHRRGILEAGDIDEALGAASAIGDDRLQRESQGRVVPDSFTHGTSEQRSRWFRRGFETGDIRQGDTFGTNNL